MALTKSKGQMYPWVTHTHSHLLGRCPHGCSYCFVQAMAKRFPAMAEKYSGSLRLDESALEVRYGKGKTIFIDHMNDLWAAKVCDDFIKAVLYHCCKWPLNTYVFQTKNPARYSQFLGCLPPNMLLGTTVETNRDYPDIKGTAPQPLERLLHIKALRPVYSTFVTIEPILDFDALPFLRWIIQANPTFVNIGADSKGTGLPEPSGEKVLALIAGLRAVGIEIRQKHNLERLIGKAG